MKLRTGVAVLVALVAVLCAGLWLGGHPGKLPSFAKEAFVAEPGGLAAEGAEALENSYYRKVGPLELGNSSLQGMVRELRRRHHDRFTEYFSPEALEGFNQEIEGHFSGIGLSVAPAKAGLKVVTVFPRSPAAEAGIEAGRTDRHRRWQVDRRPDLDRGDEADQGAGRDPGDGRRPRPEDEEDPRGDADPGRGQPAQRQPEAGSRRREEARLRAALHLQRRRRGAAAARGRKGRGRRVGRDPPRPPPQPRRAARTGGAGRRASSCRRTKS